MTVEEATYESNVDLKAQILPVGGCFISVSILDISDAGRTKERN